MTSNKQKRTRIEARREERRSKLRRKVAEDAREGRRLYLEAALARGDAVVDPRQLVRGPYDRTEFMQRGTYVPVPFTCRGCGTAEIWTPLQQKWWYEVAKGNVFSTATLCRACRRLERERKAEARRVHLEGLARTRGAG